MKSKNLLILFAFLFSICISVNLFANSFADSFGMSAEGMARGNAMTAVVDDWSAVYYNIAGLGKTPVIGGAVKDSEMTLKLRKTEGEATAGGEQKYPNQFGLGVLYTFPQLKLNIKRYGTTSSGALVPIPTNAAKMDPYGFITVGGVINLNSFFQLPDFISTARLGIASCLNSDFTLVKVNDIDLRTHDFLRYGREVEHAMIMIGAALGVLNDAFGGGVGANVQFSGKAKSLMELFLTADPQIPVSQATMELLIAPGAVAGIYMQPGKIFTAIEGLQIGASYRMETKMKINPFDVGANILGGVIGMNLYLSIYDYYSPHTVTTGIAYTFLGVTASFDINYEMWSKIGYNKVNEAHYFGKPKYNDILVWKGGIKYDTPLTWLSVMVGYSYLPSIIAKNAGTTYGIRLGTAQNIFQTGMYNLMDNDKHIAALGLKFNIPKMGMSGGPSYLTLSYQFQYLVQKSVSKNGIRLDMGTGTQDPALLNSYLLNPSYSYGGTNHSMFVEVGMKI
jgi:long-chain fatty acid transport protein